MTPSTSPLPSDLTLPLPCSHHIHRHPIYGRFYCPCNPQPTTLRQLVNTIDISPNIYQSLLSCIPTIILTTISPHPTPLVLLPPPQTAPHMADSTESASALPYRLAVPSPNPTQPTQHMPHPTLLYPYYHPHYHLTLPYPSRAPTTTSANPTYGRFYCPCNPQPTTLRQLFNTIDISCNIYISLLSYIPTIIPTTISPYPTSHVLSVPTQTSPYMAVLLIPVTPSLLPCVS